MGIFLGLESLKGRTLVSAWVMQSFWKSSIVAELLGLTVYLLIDQREGGIGRYDDLRRIRL